MRHFFKFNSLNKKFIFIISVFLLVIFSAVGVVTIINNIYKTRQSVSNQAVAFADLSTKPLAEAYSLYFDSGYYKFKEVFENTSSLDKNIERIQIIDVNGNIVFDSVNLGEDTYQQDQIVSVPLENIQYAISNLPIYIYNPHQAQEILEIYSPYFTDWQSHTYTIHYFISYEQVRRNINEIVFQTAVIALISLLVAIMLISSIVNRSILAPVTLVSQMAQKISNGKYGQRITVNTNDEIEQLAHSTNKMASTLEQNIQDLKELDKLKDEFIDIAAHNLKIPLNHIKFNIAYLLRQSKQKYDEKTLSLLRDIEINYSKLQLLSEDLLNVTAIKEGSLENSIFMPVDLVKIINEAVLEVRSALDQKKISLNSDILKTAPVLADAPKLRQVFYSLLDNAIKYSKPKGHIYIKMSEDKYFYQTKIIDEGVGMAKQDLPKLFQKFYRAPSSAVYSPEGTGLSLYLAKIIVDLHHGRVEAESEIEKGSVFTVTLFKKEAFKNSFHL